ARRTDVKLTIIRPSIIECAREFPFAGWNEGLNTSGPIAWMCTGYAWKLPMRAESSFDVVPVDTVARGMHVIVADALADRALPVPARARSHRAHGPQGLHAERRERDRASAPDAPRHHGARPRRRSQLPRARRAASDEVAP